MRILFSFMASAAGRMIRIFAGIGLIAWGFLSFSEPNSYIIAGIGVLPILTGLLNICIIAPILGFPIKGDNVSAAKS